jgi:membrane-associated phospholipid phosphatase
VKSLALGTLVALALGTVAIVACYYFVDRPVALWVHAHPLLPRESLRWPAVVSDWLRDAAAAAIVLVVLWRLGKSGGRLQAALLAISVSLVAATLLKCVLKWAFGRPWPDTWAYGRISLVGSGAYDFRPFGALPGVGAFPSGHAAMTFAVISVLWIAYPRWRWLWAAAGAGLCVALVGLNFHFVGDVVGGALLGCLTGVYAAHGFRLIPRDLPSDTA